MANRGAAMSAIPPPPPLPSSTVPAGPLPRAQVIAEPTSDAARLAVGSSVKGQVLPGAPKGVVHIQTDAGVLVGKSTLPLSEGTDLTLLLQARTPRLHLLITTMNGQSPHAPPPPAAARAAQSEAVTITLRSPDMQAPAQSATARTPPSLAPGATTNATLLHPAQPAPGTVTPPAGAGGGTTSAPPAALPAGSRVAVRVIAVHPPAAGPNGAAAAPSASGSPAITPGQMLVGNVMTSAPGTPLVLGTSLGTLGLDAISTLPRGTAVTLEIIGPPVLPSSASGAAGTPSIAPLNPAVAPWPALEAAIEALQGIDPGAARHVMDTVVPRLNTGLTSQALFFLRALGRGNIHDWLGEASTLALRSANPALLSQLGEEFRQMGHSTGETESNDWRVVHLPLLSGAEIEPIRMFLRRHGGGRKPSGNAEPNTRFVVEVTLSHLGRIQFDGLVREDGKRLDLIVRSDPPLPPALHGNIRTLFTRSSEIAGLRGEVGFQAAPAEFVDVKAEPSANPHNGMIV